ncbi:cullin-3 protein [Aphelenchoides avenae]|nr:cullin-3 protein [Aphelenchus avenae]
MRIRKFPSPLDEIGKTALLDLLKLAIRQMLNKEKPSKTYEELYGATSTLVLHGYGGELYSTLKTSLQEHAQSKVVPSLTLSVDDDLFGVLRRERSDFEHACTVIADVLKYMERVYVQQNNVLDVKELAGHVFQQEVSRHTNLSVKLRPLLVAPFLRGIDGEDVDWKSWNDSCKSLLELSDDSRQLYEEQFEVPLLREVTEHYRVKLRKVIAEKNEGDFDLLTNTFVESETLYLENVDDKTTKEWLRSVLDNVVTEAKHTNA